MKATWQGWNCKVKAALYIVGLEGRGVCYGSQKYLSFDLILHLNFFHENPLADICRDNVKEQGIGVCAGLFEVSQKEPGYIVVPAAMKILAVWKNE